jgi:hypothetical protein
VKRTTTEAELRAWIEEGLTHAQIAAKLGRFKQAVSCAVAVLGLGECKRRVTDNASALYARLCDGENVTAIAKAEGITRQAVYARLRRAGYPTTVAAALLQERAQRFPGVDIDAAHRRAA